MIEIKAPEFPESIADGEIATWHVQVGDNVKRDQILVDIETDKVVLEVVAPVDGHLSDILKQEGDTVLAEEILAHFVAGDSSAAETPKAAASTPAATPEKASAVPAEVAPVAASIEEPMVSPAAKKMAEENKVDVTQIAGTGKGGRVTKEDVLMAVASMSTATAAVSRAPVAAVAPAANEADGASGRIERRVPMTRLRASVARRLLEAQQTAAILTTFNEVDMTAIMELRNQLGLYVLLRAGLY
jgi:2-oxoglutarate dehydrogenase E2 component (dihydrolipoamide succinyltransferase)